MTEIFLLVAGILSGAVNALAGGGSFILLPALMFAGVPPVLANASNTYAAMPGYVSGAAGFWKSITRYRDRLIAYSLVSVVFGYLGAELLLVVSDEQFTIIVPWLMLVAVLLFAFGGRVSALMQTLSSRRPGAKAAGAFALWVFLAAVCIYGGFFNAGLGILLLAFLATAGLTDIHAMNGLKLWISALIALIAVIRFAASGAIDWYNGSIALLGVTVGGYLAARYAYLVPTRALRIAIIVYGVLMTAYFFWKIPG
ncbi:sulfite exporter TauE/SafE family protein [Pseudochelatococcus sp. B33]